MRTFYVCMIVTWQWKSTSLLYPFYTTPEKFKNAAISVHLDLCLRKTRATNHKLTYTQAHTFCTPFRSVYSYPTLLSILTTKCSRQTNIYFIYSNNRKKLISNHKNIEKLSLDNTLEKSRPSWTILIYILPTTTQRLRINVLILLSKQAHFQIIVAFHSNNISTVNCDFLTGILKISLFASYSF